MLNCHLLELLLEVFGCVFDIALLDRNLNRIWIALGRRLLGNLVGLVVGPKCHFVGVDLVPLHIVVDLLNLLLEATGATSFKETAVYDLDIAHRIELLVDVSQHLLAEDHQITRVTLIHWQSRCEYLEPQYVDNL